MAYSIRSPFSDNSPPACSRRVTICSTSITTHPSRRCSYQLLEHLRLHHGCYLMYFQLPPRRRSYLYLVLEHLRREHLRAATAIPRDSRSEERRVGKECRYRWSP